MAGSKEIRTKIKSVQNTRKITKAMEMVAASKMRKAQERMRHARPYGDKIRNIAAHLAHANTEYRHPFLAKRGDVKDVGVIVVTTDKGLCGGMNTNTLRLDALGLELAQLDREGAQDVGVEAAAQPLVGSDGDDAGTPQVVARDQERVPVLRIGPRQVRRDVADLVPIGARVPHAFLGLAHLGRRDHFHGLGDLARVLHALDLRPDFFRSRHQ